MKHDYRKLQFQLSQTNKQYQEAVSEKLQYQKQVRSFFGLSDEREVGRERDGGGREREGGREGEREREREREVKKCETAQ